MRCWNVILLLAAVWLNLSAEVSVEAAGSSEGKQPRQPNIVWIWADNLAYADLKCYGSETIKTPVIDRLAEEGAKFTQYYVAHVVCSPSRAALLTGRQPFRVGIVDVLRPDGPSGIPDDEITLAEALKDRGYATMAIGKWHLGDRVEYLPKQHGFDGYFGLPYSMDMLPTILYRDNEIIERLPGQKVGNITERYTDEAIHFVSANKSRPFFLYLSHTIPHPPLSLPAGVRTPGRPIYDEAIEHLDRQTGVLLEHLEEFGLKENTIVIFTSDNGPMSGGGNTGGLRGRITESYEGGIRVPLIARWPGHIPAGNVVDEPAIAYDWFPTLLNLAGGALPDDRDYDGVDIAPLLFENKRVARREPFVWISHDKITSIREGRWKLHLNHRGRALPEPELYDIQADIRESKNLASDNADVVAKLSDFAAEYQKQIPKVWSLRYPVRDPAKRKSVVRRE